MTNHTPGPWAAGPHGAGFEIIGSKRHIAKVAGDDSNPETLANALAMAAAPEMLAALQSLLDLNDKRRHPLGQPDEGIAYDLAAATANARTIIAKAEGK